MIEATGGRIAEGTAWMAGARLTDRAIGLVGTVILARRLAGSVVTISLVLWTRSYRALIAGKPKGTERLLLARIPQWNRERARWHPSNG